MCIKCEAKKAALKLVGMEMVDTKIGTIGRGFVKELAQLSVAKETLKNQMSEDVKRLLEEASEKVKKEVELKYEKKCADLQKLQYTVMTDAFVSAGFNAEELLDQEFSINKTTGEVTLRKIRPMTETSTETL